MVTLAEFNEALGRSKELQSDADELAKFYEEWGAEKELKLSKTKVFFRPGTKPMANKDVKKALLELQEGITDDFGKVSKYIRNAQSKKCAILTHQKKSSSTVKLSAVSVDVFTIFFRTGIDLMNLCDVPSAMAVPSMYKAIGSVIACIQSASADGTIASATKAKVEVYQFSMAVLEEDEEGSFALHIFEFELKGTERSGSGFFGLFKYGEAETELTLDVATFAI